MIKEFQELFASYNFKADPKEENIFGIGSRGFYENPFTEILAYILNQNTKYNYRTKFIDNLLKDHLNDDDLQGLIESSTVITQHRTEKGNYIDLILHSKKCIVVFENKIFHHANNPFADYMKDITRKFPNHEKYFILFAYKELKAPSNWDFISIPANFQRFLDSNIFEFVTKWDYFVNDFIDHFCIKKTSMTDLEKTFYQENFHKIITASTNLDNFIVNIAEEFKYSNDIFKYQKNSNWNGNTKAIRFYPIENNESNVVLIFTTEGDFSVNVYYYNNYEKYFDSVHNLLGKENYKGWKEGKEPVSCFALLVPLKELQIAIEECTKQAIIMRKFIKQLEDI